MLVFRVPGRRPGRRSATVARPRRPGSAPPRTQKSPRPARRRSSSRAGARPPLQPPTQPLPAPLPPGPHVLRPALERSRRPTPRRGPSPRPTASSARAGLCRTPLREATEQRGERRLVVIPPSGMSGGDVEVQLVAVIAVTVRGRDKQQELGGRDRQYSGQATGDRTRPTLSRRCTARFARAVRPAVPRTAVYSRPLRSRRGNRGRPSERV